MKKGISFTVNGREVLAKERDTLLIAMMNAGFSSCRRSISGELRGPLCAMGVCFECRVTVDGEANQRACLISPRNGMAVVIDA